MTDQQAPPAEVVTSGQLAHGYLAAANDEVFDSGHSRATIRALQGIGYALLDLAAATWAASAPAREEAAANPDDCDHPVADRRTLPMLVDGRSTYGLMCIRCGKALTDAEVRP